MGKGQKILGAIVILLVIALAVIFFARDRSGESVARDLTAENVAEPEGFDIIQLSIDFGDENTFIFPDVPIEDGQSVFGVLDILHRGGHIVLDYDDYGGELGVFIKSINGIGEGDANRWWQYWVNDSYAEIGMSNFVLNPDDKVLIKFTEGHL